MNAIITGATKGIGKAVTEHLAANNYNLFICARNQADLKSFTTELQLAYPNIKIYGIPTDCSNQASLQKFADFVQQHLSSPDVLVNNAGTYIPSSIFDEKEDLLQKQWQLNVNCAYYLSKVFGNKMRQAAKGHIFNICSIASLYPVKEAAAYTVTKFALLGLTKVLQQELKPMGVKVTAILPGSVFTSSWDGSNENSDKFVQPNDIAAAIITCLKLSKSANVDELIIQPLT